MAMRIRGLRKQRRREKDPHGNEYRMSGPGRRACTQSFFRFIERNWFQKPKRSIHRKKVGQCRKFPWKMWETRTKFLGKMWERVGGVRKQVGAFRFGGTSARVLLDACEWLFQLAGIPQLSLVRYRFPVAGGLGRSAGRAAVARPYACARERFAKAYGCVKGCAVWE